MHDVTVMQADRATRIVLAIAAVWSVGLVIAAAVAPWYSSTSVSTSGLVVRGSATLVQENGLRVLMPICVPLLAVGVVTFSLWRRRKQVRSGAGALAWMLTALLAGFTLVSMLTIGLFVLPVTVLVIVACARA